jgi:hypothetical protein
MGVVAVREPEVPATVIVAKPVAAVLLAVRVSTLVLVVGLVENAAVTPLGSPDADKLTLPVNPFRGVTVIVDVPFAPCVTLREAGEAPIVKLGAGLTVRVTVAFAVV